MAVEILNFFALSQQGFLCAMNVKVIFCSCVFERLSLSNILKVWMNLPGKYPQKEQDNFGHCV